MLAILALGGMTNETVKAQQTGVTVETVGAPQNTMVRVNEERKFLMLPIEESAPECDIRLLVDAQVTKTFNAHLALDRVDYYVPVELDCYKGHKVLLDVFSHDRNMHNQTSQWKGMITLSDEFDTTNKELWRPTFHHTPVYGWMNDPNGMFFDETTETWHLYYQWGPYGSMWNNMTWRHSSSKDLINWTDEGVAIESDAAMGQVFSGSCVVDKENSAGFGKGAVIALYTGAGESQRQCLAYSTDGGKTFTKYAGNPVLSAGIPDFRDPNMFWNESIKAWNLILAAGQEMRIYSSPNLIDWKEESRFGLGYGNHGGVWECPDLMQVKVLDENGKATGREKWVLLCNINPGGPWGGSATQYFVGDFDGHQFMCEDEAYETKWMDYGKDHYATVSFSGAPDGRKTVLAWMSNWEYANQVPTKQFRSANSVARDLFLYEVDGETYLGSRPSQEYDGGVLNSILKGADQTIKVKGSGSWTVSNAKGEKVTIDYDAKAKTLKVIRTSSGVQSFAPSFPTVTTAPVHRPLTNIRVISDNASVEVFGNNGEVVLTNLVFPTAPLTKIKAVK